MSPPFNLVAEELGYKNFMDLNASGIVYPHQQLVSGRASRGTSEIPSCAS